MFSQSLLETSWAERGRRSWTALTSFGLQALIIGWLMLIQLLTTVGLPMARTVSTPIRVTRSDPGPTPQPHQGGRSGVRIIPYPGRIILPAHLSRWIHNGPDLGEQPMASSGGPDLGSYVPSEPGLPIPILGTHPLLPVAPKSIERAFRKSEILEGSLIRKVEPRYPPLAISARIQGPVVLAAEIGKAGTIENLRLVSGHPMLAEAAMDAVRQWRYRPYILNGDVIEVETEITVNFVLGR